jgi:histidine ammonia-lyase
MSTIFRYGKDKLTAGKALAIAQGASQGVIDEMTREKIIRSAGIVKQIADGDKAVYGINTGFGPLCTTMISKEKTTELQHNILMSHAVGLGAPIDDIISKLMMILKVQALAQGFSGVQESTLDRIIWHIDQDIIPVVPSQGSVGASGDLAPLSHLFLPLIGLGYVKVAGKKYTSAEVLSHHEMTSLQLSPKEGLGLINGTQFIAAHAVLVVEKMYNLITSANVTGAMMIEGLLGSVKPFSRELHELRPFPANQYVAQFVLELLEDSEVVQSHTNCARVQDPYSLRCIPQVHGASLASWLHLKDLLEIELNAVTDNPVVFDVDHTISGGNFHGQPLAMALDYACLACSEIGNISDRRTYLSLEGDTPGVPKLLLKETGTNSGFMIPQYTSAALASENKGLCFPASADSIPTSLGQEDHVSMGSISARKALQVIGNSEKILGIELFCAAQALDFHMPLASSRYMAKVHQYVRESIPHLEKDQIMSEYMEEAIMMVSEGHLKRLTYNPNSTNPFSGLFEIH